MLASGIALRLRCLLHEHYLALHSSSPSISTTCSLQVIDAEAAACMAKTGITVHYTVGNMLETPRAALVADQIARTAAFFSFGTNDLTQMTFGYSRDDAPKFIPK